MENILDGKKLAEQMKASLKDKIAKLPYSIRLAVVMVEGNSASQIYVDNKIKACKALGIECNLYTFSATTDENEVANILQNLAEDRKVHGILLQLPLPKHMNKDKLLKLIPAEKDVDGFSGENIGELCLKGLRGNAFIPCTPLGILELLRSNQIEISGKNVVVVGRSNIVGKPMAMLLLTEGATVTICHKLTKNLAQFTRQADILIVAVGKRNLIDADMVKEGVVIVDVGINRMEDGKICGDVHFESVQKKAKAMTPVPGGVGPMTIAMLLYNTYQAAKQQEERV